MQTTLGVDVLGVVQPGAVQAVAATRNGRVGYMATEATVASGAYERAIAAADPFVTVTAVACPELVPLIERGSPFDARIVDAVRHYTRPLREARGGHGDPRLHALPADPRRLLQRMLGRGVEIVSSGVPVARQVEHVLGSRGLGNPRAGEGDYRFLTSGDPEALRAPGTRFLQLPLGPVEHVPLPAAELAGGAADEPPERSGGRAADELRPVTIEPGFVRTATGSALIACGGTRVICTASVRGVGAALDGRPGPRLDDRRVRDAPRVDGRRASSATSRRAGRTAARWRSSG